MSEEVKEGLKTEGEGSQKPITQEQLKYMRKQAAMELAEYRKRLRESVELKELQTRELELNIKYYHLRQEHKKIQVLIQEEEAKEIAEAQARQEAAKKPKLEVVKTGKPRTEQEIESAKAE